MSLRYGHFHRCILWQESRPKTEKLLTSIASIASIRRIKFDVHEAHERNKESFFNNFLFEIACFPRRLLREQSQFRITEASPRGASTAERRLRAKQELNLSHCTQTRFVCPGQGSSPQLSCLRRNAGAHPPPKRARHRFSAPCMFFYITLSHVYLISPPSTF